MPSLSPHTLVWSEVQQHYELQIHGQRARHFHRGDEPAWHTWLAEQTAFAFEGHAGGRLSVLKETRSRGAGYWYAYRTKGRHTRKQYVGPTIKVTFDRLEEAAQALQSEGPSATSASSWTPPERVVGSAHEAGVDREESRPDAKPQAEQELTLLAPKLSRPRLSAQLVERTRLLSELQAVRAHPVTLVSASAGSGKTTLLAAWASLASRPQENQETEEGVQRNWPQSQFAWLSLDELDNEPTRYWTAVIAALRTCLPRCGHTALAMLRSPNSPAIATILLTLLQDLVEEVTDVILILDDYHVISDQAILESMRFLVEHAPASLHLVLATRSDPELPLARLRVRSRLLEIRDRDLRFTESEAATFLTRDMGLPLSAGEVATLHQRTEGWIAGLQLAALASHKHENVSTFVTDFAGSHRFLLDYVRQEILTQLPDTLQAFLLQTAILSRMSAALCQAVTDSPSLPASQDALEALERRNLFLVPLDEERRWYRLHDLLREALLAALHTTQPETVPLLHRRAATYYEAHGAWSEAITHRLAAADYAEATQLMERTVERFMIQGQAARLAQWVLALPEPLAHTYSRLALTAALYLLNTVTYATGEQRAMTHATVRQLMARVETADLRLRNQRPATAEAVLAPPIGPARDGDAAASAAEEIRLHLRLRILRTYLAFLDAAVRGEHERLSRMQPEIQKIAEIQAALDHDADEDSAEAIWQLAPISWSFVLHYTVRQEGALLLPRLFAAKELMSRSGSHFAIIKVMQYVATAALEAGQLRVAYEESQAALDLIEQTASYALLKGYFALVLVDVLYQWNRLEEALSWLHTLLEGASTWQHLDLLGVGYFYMVPVELARGDGTAAQQALRRLEDLVRREHFGTHPGVLPAMQALWRLSEGHMAEAAAWATGVVFPEGAWGVNLYDAFPIVVRVHYAQRRWGEALDLLERWRGHLDRPGNIRITITFLAQYLIALHQTGKRERACGTAARLFALTEPEGYLRVYLDEGEPMRQALQALQRWCTSRRQGQQELTLAPSTSTYVATLLTAFKQVDERRSPRGTATSSATTHGADTAPAPSREAISQMPIEPLSPQEQRVLRLLVAGQTYGEIAEALVVSPNTIKTQVSSIYRKLGVSRRAEAIALASRLRLL